MPTNLDPTTGASNSISPAGNTAANTVDFNTPGGGGQGGGFDIRQGTNPITGWASQFDPVMLNNIIWDNPWAVLPKTFEGLNSASPGYQAMRDFGADPLTLYNIMNGSGNNDLASAGVGGFANFMHALYQSMASQGGRQFSTRELLNNIAGAGQNSALGKIMTQGDAGTQVRTLYRLIQESTNAGMNPLAARGYQAAAARQGDQYLAAAMTPGSDGTAATGPASQPFYQWMHSQGYL
jgi:hypothetical protein